MRAQEVSHGPLRPAEESRKGRGWCAWMDRWSRVQAGRLPRTHAPSHRQQGPLLRSVDMGEGEARGRGVGSVGVPGCTAALAVGGCDCRWQQTFIMRLFSNESFYDNATNNE